MTKLSPSAAAKAWKVGKSTIYKAMSEGSLSYSTDDSQRRLIDKSEMVRFFGEPKKDENTLNASNKDNDRIADLKEAMERQERQYSDYIQTLKDQISSQQKQLDAMTNAVDKITNLLEHHQPVEVSDKLGTKHRIEPTDAPSDPGEGIKNVKKQKSLLKRLISVVIED